MIIVTCLSVLLVLVILQVFESLYFCIFLIQASFILNWRWLEPLQVQKLQPELFRIREPRVPNRRWVDWRKT